MLMEIPSIGYSFSFSRTPMIDPEEKAIMDRLLLYGIVPTGNKDIDRSKLRKIEIEKAHQDNYVSNKYLTVSTSECQKIQDEKKQKKEVTNPTKTPNIEEKRPGAKLLGDQVFLAIMMKQDLENNNTKTDDTNSLKKVS